MSVIIYEWLKNINLKWCDVYIKKNSLNLINYFSSIKLV